MVSLTSQKLSIACCLKPSLITKLLLLTTGLRIRQPKRFSPFLASSITVNQTKDRLPPRNTGLHLAKGEFLAFLDSDDLWHKDMLRVCLNILTARPEIAAVHANWLPIDAQGNIVKASSGWKPWRGDIFDRLLVHIPFNTSSILWRRECWERIGGFDETPEINDDWINWLRIARRGYHFEAIEDPLVYRRMHEDSITRGTSRCASSSGV